MRRFLAAVFLTSLVGCASHRLSQPPQEQLLFSVRTTKTAFFGEAKHKNGIFFHLDGEGNVWARQFVSGIQTPSVSSSINRRKLLHELEQIGFEPFDFDLEASRIDRELAATFSKEGKTYIGPHTFDGAEFEIRLSNGPQSFQLTRWNPGHQIEFYSAYSPKMAKLKAVIDLFARNYGLNAFGLM